MITNAPRGVGEATKAKTNDGERREKTLYSDVRREGQKRATARKSASGV